MTNQTLRANQHRTERVGQPRITPRRVEIWGCAIGVLVLIAGCSEDETPRPSASNSRVAAPVQREPPPPIWTINDLELRDNVQFPEQVMPRSREVAEAVASFASALASGNSVSLQGVLAPRDRAVLREMIDNGGWVGYAQSIDGVRVSVLQEQDEGFRLGLAVMHKKVAYLTGWEASVADGNWTFTGLNIGRIEANRLALLDGASLELVSTGQRNSVELIPEIPVATSPSDGAAPAGGGFGASGGGGGLPSKPSDF